MSPAARAAAVARSRLSRAALVAALATALGVFHVWSRTRVLAAGYALGELQNVHVKLESEHDRLRIEVETLRSPAAVERFARTKLGMAPPEPGAVSAAGSLLAAEGSGGAEGVGVGHLTGPAEPSRSKEGRRAASLATTAESGGRLAFRGPLRAGRTAPRGR